MGSVEMFNNQPRRKITLGVELATDCADAVDLYATMCPQVQSTGRSSLNLVGDLSSNMTTN